MADSTQTSSTASEASTAEESERARPAAPDAATEGGASLPLDRALYISHTLIPVLLTALGVAVIAAVAGWPKLGALGTAAVVALSGPGKFIILSGAIEGIPLTRFELAALITYMDCVTAFFLVFNMDLLYKVRAVGPALHDMEDFGHAVLENNRWIRNASFAGVMLFVMFPVSGTGALGASVLGRLIGMNRYRIMLAVVLGAFISCFALAMLAGHIHPTVADHWAFKYLGFPVFLVVVAVAGRRFQQIRRMRRGRGGGAGRGSSETVRHS